MGVVVAVAAVALAAVDAAVAAEAEEVANTPPLTILLTIFRSFLVSNTTMNNNTSAAASDYFTNLPNGRWNRWNSRSYIKYSKKAQTPPWTEEIAASWKQNLILI